MISFKVLCLVIRPCPGGVGENSVQPAVVGHATVVLAVNKILFHFSHLPTILQQEQQLIFLEKQYTILCKVTSSGWFYKLKKAKHILKAAEIPSLTK